jgi:hypothetical protein
MRVRTYSSQAVVTRSGDAFLRIPPMLTALH